MRSRTETSRCRIAEAQQVLTFANQEHGGECGNTALRRRRVRAANDNLDISSRETAGITGVKNVLQRGLNQPLT